MTESNSYVELYKKYRPNSWEELIGQESVSRTLKSAISNDRIPTAYGFFGPRGCGKTTAALILAKALNCLNLKEGSNPCNECEICLAIDDGTQMGVSYISMANSGSVNDVREIVKRAWTKQPINKQIWILDEVHNLHPAAFDSLLIPIENPKMPSHFILCSTAIEKIPVTILSRIQQLKFRRVAPDKVYDYLQKIAKNEDIENDDALRAAVRLGRGSVRDTLTNLEYVLASGLEEVETTADLLRAISNHDTGAAFGAIANAWSNGVQPRDYAEQLIEDLRNLLLKVSKVDDDLIGVLPVDDVAQLVKGFVSKAGLIFAINEIGEAITKMTAGSEGRISLEISVAKVITNLSKAGRAKTA